MKKGNQLAFLTACCLTSSLLATGVNAVVTADPATRAADAKHLGAGLVLQEVLTTADDFDGNRVINAFDLTLLKRSILQASEHTGELKTAEYAATAENVKLIGRTCRKQDITWLVHSGSAAEFTVTGTAATLTLAGDSSINSAEKYRPRYAVLVDGELLTDALLSDKELEIPLFSGDTARTAVVQVIHLSEANNGAIGVRKLSVTSSAAKPVQPTAKKALSIEFIGDSITCAYGVEGKDQYENFATSTENFMKSYAYLTAQQLHADYSAVSYSGYGIISGYTSGEKNTDSLVPDCYSLIGKPSDYAQPWDFESHTNDVVVINLGTNDNSYIGTDLEGRGAEFVEGYQAFLTDVRRLNPEAYIICTMGTMGGESVYGLVDAAVKAYQAASGDKRIHSYQSATQKPANGLGSDWHPSPVTQQQSAYVLADQICQALGLPSDRIGLDAAADGNYDVYLNEDAGANAATYLGYDKSYWVNMVSGGTKPEDVKAYVNKISLIPGTYQLEFDCTSTVDVTIPYAVQHRDDPTRSYCSGELQTTGQSQHVSETFQITQADDDCEIAFLLGGTDYYNATFSNVTLYKIS